MPTRPEESRQDEEFFHDICALRQWAVSVPHITHVWIFGSRVRCSHRHDSDLDVAVEHEIDGADPTLEATALCFRDDWQPILQQMLRLKLDLWSVWNSDIVKAGLARSSRLIYTRK